MFLFKMWDTNTSAKAPSGVELSRHFVSLDLQKGTLGHRRGGRRPDQLTGQAAFTEKLALVQHRDHGLFAGVRHDGEADRSLLDVDDGCGWFPLTEDRGARFIRDAADPHTGPLQRVGVAPRLSLPLLHRALPSS
jgi:hypothetical protein